MIFSDNNRIKLNPKRNISGKFPNVWKPNTYINSQWIKEETQMEIKTYFELN